MRTPLLVIMLCFFTFTQSACSVYKALSQPPPADLSGIGPGTTRQELIVRLGAPKFTETDSQGKKEDTFEFQSGMHQGTKLRAILYLAADVFTLSLAELILWPLELTVMERATCTGVATYDLNQKVETWAAGKTTSSQGLQGC